MPRTSSKIVAEITLYGTSQIGAGWLAMAAKSHAIAGDGVPMAGRSFTEAVWQAAGALEALGVKTPGCVRIFAPGGQRMATVQLGGLIPCFGDLQWEPAITYTLDVKALTAAATPEGR